MNEIPLGGGRVTQGVVRVGDTVRRPASERSPFVHTVLLHLEREGFEGAPRFLGIDEQGRERLSFVEGEALAVVDRLSDARIRSGAALLRRLHDAASSADELRQGHETVVHGDAGPWNMIWRGDDAVALIDFDEARPGSRREDLGYFAWKGLQLHERGPAPAEQARRLRVLADAYGVLVDDGLLAAIDASYDWLAAKGTGEQWPGEAVDEIRAGQAWFRRALPALR